MHENILKKTNLLYRYCVIYFNFLSIGMHALEYCRIYVIRHMTYKFQYFGPAVLELCAHSGTTDVRALKQASSAFDRGALRLLGTSGKFSAIFAIHWPVLFSHTLPVHAVIRHMTYLSHRRIVQELGPKVCFRPACSHGG